MAYTEKEINKAFDYVIQQIESGCSVNSILKEQGTPGSETFYKWIDEDKEKAKKYVRACEDRADLIFEDILHIADDSTNDTQTVDMSGVEIEVVNKENVQRSRLRVDARKWMLSKMNPKKYGDKIDHTTGGERMNTGATQHTVIFQDASKKK